MMLRPPNGNDRGLKDTSSAGSMGLALRDCGVGGSSFVLSRISRLGLVFPMSSYRPCCLLCIGLATTAFAGSSALTMLALAKDADSAIEV